MPLDSIGRYTANHKSWDHVGNMVPNVEHSEGVRPHGEFKPAPWLPVQFYDKYQENWFVVMPGKLISFDNNGHVVPAQYGLAGATITYVAADVTAGVLDVRTGETLLIGAIGTFNVAAVTDFMGTGEAMSVSRPVGVAPYAYIQWAGDGGEYDDGSTPAAYRQHNYNMQHRVAILCDYVLELPLVPAEQSTAVALTQFSYSASVALLTGTFTGMLPIAKNTVRTPVTFSEGAGAPGDVATKFAVEKFSSDDVKASGDWYMDPATGNVYVYSALHVGATDYEVTFYHYGSAPTGSDVSKFACALGDLKPGEFVMCNADSNYVVADPASYNFADIVGQVLEKEDVYDKDALGKVRTAYSSLGTDASGSLPAYAGQMDQMPGSANGSVTDNVHYAGAANLVVRINLISR